MHLKLGALISGGGRTILNLLQSIRDGGLNAEISVVVASRKCRGVELLSREGLDVRVVPYRKMPDVATYSEAIVSHLDDAEVDLVIQGGFLSFWEVPDRYSGLVMNIHPALLPSFGGKGMYGMHVHQAVLERGCKVSGCTVHFVNNEYDAGPIIVQRTVQVREDDSPETLAAKVFEHECIAYPEAIRLFSEGRLRVAPGGTVEVSRD